MIISRESHSRLSWIWWTLEGIKFLESPRIGWGLRSNLGLRRRLLMRCLVWKSTSVAQVRSPRRHSDSFCRCLTSARIAPREQSRSRQSTSWTRWPSSRRRRTTWTLMTFRRTKSSHLLSLCLPRLWSTTRASWRHLKTWMASLSYKTFWRQSLTTTWMSTQSKSCTISWLRSSVMILKPFRSLKTTWKYPYSR